MLLVPTLTLIACTGQTTKPSGLSPALTATSPTVDTLHEQQTLQALVRKMLQWSDTSTLDLLPVQADAQDSVYLDFDFDKHTANLTKLKRSGLFADAFLKNYDQIIHTLDSQYKQGAYGSWMVGDIAPFALLNNGSPWTLSDDIPYDTPNPFDHVIVTINDLKPGSTSGIWKWEKPALSQNPDWNTVYKFTAVKEQGQWKIAYLQGFDYKEAIK